MPVKYYKPAPGKPFKLDIGSGKFGWQREPLDEWTHLDIVEHEHVEIVCDFGAIPIGKGAVDEIFIGDVVEHVPAWRYDEVFTEWNRILKVGGIVSGRCPNIDRAMRDYANGTLSYEDAIRSIYGWAHMQTEQHYQGFTRETLTTLLRKYGFEINDYTGSPGPVDVPWWLVFTGYKATNVKA